MDYSCSAFGAVLVVKAKKAQKVGSRQGQSKKQPCRRDNVRMDQMWVMDKLGLSSRQHARSGSVLTAVGGALGIQEQLRYRMLAAGNGIPAVGCSDRPRLRVGEKQRRPHPRSRPPPRECTLASRCTVDRDQKSLRTSTGDHQPQCTASESLPWLAQLAWLES